MLILYCDGNKCRIKNNCIRYNHPLKEKDPLKVSDFHSFCNKKNNYLWIYLDPRCQNKKYKDIYKERIKTCLTRIH